MLIDGKVLSTKILEKLKADIKDGIKSGKKAPKLVVVSVGHSHESAQFIANKEKSAKYIGADFKHVHYKRSPKFEEFIRTISNIGHDPEVTAMIVQKPLPANLASETLVNYIPPQKEIEGFSKKSPHVPPLGLAVLTVLKYVYTPSDRDMVENIVVDLKKDSQLIKSLIKRKKIVLLGRGETGGAPIGKTLSDLKINYINLNSQTPQPDSFMQEADIIISAVGKKTITGISLKQGCILMSIGLHLDKDKWVGDYNEKEIDPIAGFYTPTPGGIGPLNVAYLMYNLLEAWKFKSSQIAHRHSLSIET